MDSGSNPTAPSSLTVKQQVQQQTALKLLAQARLHVDSGNLLKAQACCAQALLRTPDAPDVLMLQATVHRLSNAPLSALEVLLEILLHTPNHDAASKQLVDLLETTELDETLESSLLALIQHPDLTESRLATLADNLFNHKHYSMALTAYTRLSVTTPDNPELLLHIADCQNLTGQFDAAERNYANYLASPDLAGPSALVKLGLTLGQNGKPKEAEASFRQALACSPGYFAALLSLTEVLVEQDRFAEAETVAEEMLQRYPEDHRVMFRVASVFTHQARYPEAAGLLAQLVRNSLGNFQASLALSHVYLKKQDYPLARLTTTRLLEQDPTNTDAWLNLGVIAERELQPDEAITYYRHGLNLDPDNAALQYNLSNALLRTGVFEAGWTLYESRLKLPHLAHLTRHPSPRWNGESLLGKSLYIVLEQGFGDLIQCMAYLPVLKHMGATLLMECPRPLASLAASMQVIDQIILDREELPPADFHIPIMSLPLVLGEGYRFSFPRTPWLHADQDKVAWWRQRLPFPDKFRIGICWQGRITFGADEIRSFPLMTFLPLADLDTVALVSVQKEPAGKQQIPEFRLFSTITDADDLAEGERDFMDTAAIMQNLDLIITSDTSVAHLAGALGKPVWVILGELADWRWFLNHEDAYWYACMRLFRKQPGEPWSAVMQRVQSALLEHLSAPGGAR